MRRPSRILLVLHRGGRAGTEYHVLWLAAELRIRGWQVHVVVSEPGPMLKDFAEDGIQVHVVRRDFRCDHRFVHGLARLGRSISADILHAHSGRVAALAGRFAGIPAILETRHGLGLAPRLSTEARLCRLAHHTLTVCESDRARLISGGLPADRVTAVRNGIPVSTGSHSFDPNRLRLGFLGRLTPQKNPLFLVDLAREINDRIPGRWSLAIAGNGPLRSELERKVRARPDLANAIYWLGEIEGPGLLHERSDYLCLPSLWEGQPLSILEAMTGGVVPIATALPSLVELLGGEPPAGLLLDLDARAWAKALIQVHESQARNDAMKQEGLRRIRERHQVASMVDRIEEVYRVQFASHGADW